MAALGSGMHALTSGSLGSGSSSPRLEDLGEQADAEDEEEEEEDDEETQGDASDDIENKQTDSKHTALQFAKKLSAKEVALCEISKSLEDIPMATSLQEAATLAMSEAHSLQKEMQLVAGTKACDIHVRVARKLCRKTNLFLERVHEISVRARPYMKKEAAGGATKGMAKLGTGGKKAPKGVAKLGTGGKKAKGKEPTQVKSKGKGKGTEEVKAKDGKGKGTKEVKAGASKSVKLLAAAIKAKDKARAAQKRPSGDASMKKPAEGRKKLRLAQPKESEDDEDEKSEVEAAADGGRGLRMDDA